MRKALSIAWKDVFVTFTDRNLILIMLITPLTLATIIALAFSNIIEGGGFQNIPVALVNLDRPGTGIQDFGSIYLSAFLPEESTAERPTCDVMVESQGSSESSGMTRVEDLTDAEIYHDAESARQAVRDGTVAAAVIIPQGLNQRLNYQPGQTQTSDPVQVEVYGDPNRSVSAGIIRSIVEGLSNQVATGQIAMAASIDTLIASGRASNIDPDILVCGYLPGLNTVGIEREMIEGDEFDPLVVFGSAQAAFFALFTAAGGASSILEERQNGTLQRMIVSPTSRSHIFLGKLIGVFTMVLLQLAFLFVSFTLVGSLIDGEFKLIWGSNVVAIVALLFALSLSAAGVGLIIATLGKTPDQVNVIGGVIAMVMGILGGAFFAVEALGNLEFITRISIVRWGSEAFAKLANGHNDIGLNLAVLVLIGSLLFGASLFILNRRQDL